MARENELYRDKIEVSLDGRQIFSLFFAGAVIVCTVFVIGVIVGKRVEARAHVDRGAAASGDPLAALDRLEADAPLSFRRTLRGGQSASGTVDAEIAAMASAQKAAGGDAAKSAKLLANEDASEGEDAVSAEQAAAKKAPEKADAKADKADAKAARLEGHDDERAEAKPSAKAEKADAKTEAKADAKADAKTEAKADAKLDAKADAKLEAKADAKADAKLDAKAEKADDKKKAKYTLQLSSFQERGEAETFLAELRAAGYSASVVPAEIEGKGTFYRVRLGTYPSFDDAVKAKAEFERKVSRIAYVTKL